MVAADHPLIRNLEDWLSQSYVDEKVKPLLRSINATLLERHGARLFPDATLVMTAQECSVRGHATMARNKHHRARCEVGLLDDQEEWQIKRLTDEIALELEYFEFDLYRRLAAEGHGRYAFCPYVLVTAGGVTLDPATLEPHVPLRYLGGNIPLDKPA